MLLCQNYIDSHTRKQYRDCAIDPGSVSMLELSTYLVTVCLCTIGIPCVADI